MCYLHEVEEAPVLAASSPNHNSGGSDNTPAPSVCCFFEEPKQLNFKLDNWNHWNKLSSGVNPVYLHVQAFDTDFKKVCNPK